VISLLAGILGLLCSVTLFKETSTERKPGARITAAAFSVSAVVMIGRAIFLALGITNRSMFAFSWLNAVLSLAATLAVLWWSVSFIIMTDEGLMVNLKEAEGIAARATAEVTERRQVEVLLRQSEAHFRGMADTAPVMICLFGLDKLATFFNKGWLDFTGRALDQELGHGWTTGVHGNDLDSCLAAYSAAYDAREICNVEYRLRRFDGDYRWVLFRGVPRFEPRGVFAGYICSAIDITEVKGANEEAVTRQKLESLGVLSAGISHDFNNVLGSIVAQTDLALMQLADGDSPVAEIQRIKTVAMRASEIVRELMIYSGHDKTQLEPVNVSRLVEEMMELLKVSISKHAELRVDLHKELPAIRGTPSQIRQVVLNLLINASEAIGEGHGIIRVSTSLIRPGDRKPRKGPMNLFDGDCLRLEISDTGCGMSEEVKSKVFDPFFTTKFVGRGLGLAVVQGIVRAHGGVIDLVSAPGKGTMFQIFLPCVTEADQPARMPAAALGEHNSGAAGTVLLVEDEDTLRLSVSKMLRKKGFSVVEAGDGSQAVDLFRLNKDNVDVMLLDITIPGMSSREVLEEVGRTRPTVKVILTSAYSREMASLDAVQVKGFIRKPFQFGDLMQLLSETMAS
jgi:PAS domain S-box-containing protein